MTPITFNDLRIGSVFRMSGITEYIKLTPTHASATIGGAVPAIVSIDPASEVSQFKDDLGNWQPFKK